MWSLRAFLGVSPIDVFPSRSMTIPALQGIARVRALLHPWGTSATLQDAYDAVECANGWGFVLASPATAPGYHMYTE
jgi:hypothetical protein